MKDRRHLLSACDSVNVEKIGYRNAGASSFKRGYMMITMKYLRCTVGIAALAAASTSAQAVSYTGSASTGADDVHTGTTETPTTYTASANGYATTTASATNGTSSTSQASVGIGQLFGQAYSNINYSFQVTGADNVMVPVLVQAHGYAEGSGNDFFEGNVNFQLSPGFGEGILSQVFADNGIYGNYNELSIDQIVYMLSNVDNHVFTSTLAFAHGGSEVSGSAFAYIDPTFTIVDPAYSGLFKITGVPGEGTASSTVPEPATWAMMVIGFGVIGVTTRRRQTHVVA